MGILWIILLSLISLVLLLVYLARRDADHFQSKGITYLWNGSYRMALGMFRGLSIFINVQETYKVVKDKGLKLAGVKDMGIPSLVLVDPEIIKHVLVKDFDHFVNRRFFQFPKADGLFSNMLLIQQGDKWKQLRSKLSPTFTTGKIKRMFQIMKKSGDKFVAFLQEEVERSEQGGEVELSNAYSKMTMDVIASAACAIDSKVFESKEVSVFEKMANKFKLRFKGLEMLKFLFLAMFPSIGDLLGLSFFGREVQEFFSGAIKSSIRVREEKGEKRDDFIQLMLEVRSNKLANTDEDELGQFEKDAIIKSNVEDNNELLDDDGIVANCVLFIIGGFETTQALMMFVAYCLALHQEVQDKLRVEVDRIFEECDGDLTYDAINKMEYMDMVINETLRLYPPAVQTDRGCVKDYKVPGTDFVLKKGEGVIIPILGLHHDEKYWPEPQYFIPERFSPENKSKINQYTFMPFGQGPRNCIGMRFALTEVKLVISSLVRNFKIEPSQKTPIPMKFANLGTLQPDGGLWLGLHKRDL